MPEVTCSSTVLSPVLSSGGSIEPPHDPECLPARDGRIDQSLGERVYLGASKKYAGFAGCVEEASSVNQRIKKVLSPSG